MKAGFLAQRGPAAKKAAIQSARHVVTPSATAPTDVSQAQAAPAAATGSTGSVPAPANVQLTPEQWNSNFQQCLELLRGPADETRFVGLLLAVKLLPQGGPDALRQVHAAVGWPFIQRLLLPLDRGVNVALGHEQLQQQELLVGLGLSVLSALCQLPDIAASAEMQALLPALLKVTASGSLPQALSSSQLQDTAAAPARLDWAVTGDAVDCLLAAAATTDTTAAAAASQQLWSLGGPAKADALLRSVLLSGRGAQWQAGVLGVPNAWRLPVTVVRLLGVLLAVPPSDQGVQFQHIQAVSAELVPVLCHLLGLPEVLNSQAAATAARTQRARQRQQQHAQQQELLQREQEAQLVKEGLEQQAQQHQQQLSPEQQQMTAQLQQALSQAVNELLPTGPASTAAPETSSEVVADQSAAEMSSSTGEDAALLQLEALTTLHQLTVALAATGASWDSQLVQPLLAVAEAPAGDGLQGWGAAARRGLGWVLRGGLGEGYRHRALQVAAALTELLGPEWLLGSAASDSLDKAKQQSPHMFATVLAETAQIELGLLLRDALHVNCGTSSTGEADSALLPGERLLKELQDAAQQKDVDGNQPTTQEPQPLTAAGTASVHPALPSPAIDAAAQRAQQRLPAVLSLLEGLLEAVARQADSSGTPSVSVSLQQQLVMSVGASVQLVLQFFLSVEDVAALQAAHRDFTATPAGEAHVQHTTIPSSGAAHQQPTLSVAEAQRMPPAEVLLACTRLVGHYYAEVPDAWSAQTWAVLPVLLDPCVGLGTSGVGDSSDRAQLRDLALQFMLPGLSQVCGAPQVQDQLADALISPKTLPLLTAALQRTAQHATALAATMNSDRSAEGQLQLKASERQLADICMVLVHALTGKPEVLKQMQTSAIQLLSASAAVSAWVQQRVAVAMESSDPLETVAGMARASLLPRPVLCPCTLVALVLLSSRHMLLHAHGHVSVGQVATMCHVAVIGVVVGYALSIVQVMNDLEPGSAQACMHSKGMMVTERDVNSILDDMAGDAEHCWDVACGACAEAASSLPELKSGLVAALAGRLSHGGLHDIAAHQMQAESAAWSRLLACLGL